MTVMMMMMTRLSRRKKRKKGKINKIKKGENFVSIDGRVLVPASCVVFFLVDHLLLLGLKEEHIGNNATTSFFGIVLVVVTQSNLPGRAPKRVKLVRVGMQSSLVHLYYVL